MPEHEESTELVLFVRGSGDDIIIGWDRRKIVDALVRETDVDQATADEISLEVEALIARSGISTVTAPLVRELVDAKLLERGLEKAWRMHSRVGFPLYDVEGIILSPNRENANIPHSPEATSLTLAEGIKKNYALEKVFSREVGDAHLRGDIHIHNMGFIDRAYSSYQSLEYLKKFGLSLPGSPSAARPAKHPEVLLAHMVRYAAALQTQFAGSIGWDAVNISFAPYLEGMNDDQVKQFAQMMIFEFSQQAVARGGQSIYTYLSLPLKIPAYLSEVEAIGPGGMEVGRRYKAYEEESRRLLKAILDVYLEGDGSGRPFFFPIPVIRIEKSSFETGDPLLDLAVELSIRSGNPIFSYERDGLSYIPDYGIIDFSDGGWAEDASSPWRMRYASLQNVTINLPRIGYTCGATVTSLYDHLSRVIDIAVRAHLEKKAFLERLLSLGENGPLSLLTMKLDGTHYLRVNRSTWLTGVVGLNELVKSVKGMELHESETAMDFGAKILGFIREKIEMAGSSAGINVLLNQTPAESTAYRFARLDMRHYPGSAGRIVRGDIALGEVYYTNSSHLNPSAVLHPVEKSGLEGRLHRLFQTNPLTNIWTDGTEPSVAEVVGFLKETFYSTECPQVAISPDFTVCNDCGGIFKGLLESCPCCGSPDLDGISKITTYMSRISGWNKGKLGELRDRFKTPFRS